MTHLQIVENLLYGAMEASNELLDEMFLLTACGRVEPQDGETFEDALDRTCNELRNECRTMRDNIAFYHEGIFVGDKVQGEMYYDEL